MNIDILGISELKWIGMGEFKSDDHYIYYCWEELHRRNGVALIVYKRVYFKNDRMISVHFQGKPFSITIIQVKSMPQPLMPKKVKLNGSMIYKTF